MNNTRIYRIVRPPRAIRKAKLDNIALVPASLLHRKSKYQTIANNLPTGGVFIRQSNKTQKISRIFERVAKLFQEKGHFVRTLLYSLI
jgi:hypothetical protein